MFKAPLITPTGQNAQDIDKVMLLAIWTRQLQLENPESIFCMAAMGKPSFPVNDFAASAAATHWNKLWSHAQDVRHYIHSSTENSPEYRDHIAEVAAAVDYGDPRGQLEARTKMATALSDWYNKKIKITPDNILFTVGGAGALYCTFDVINYKKPGGRILTPFPYYSLYQGHRGKNRLHPINVMELPGYRLTADALQKSIIEANALGELDGGKVSAFLFSDPNNPLGTFIEKEEMLKIIAVLQQYPEIYIIIDGAYEEMRLDTRKHESLLYFAPPEMLNRIILLRSATKALSLAGERMAILVAFNEELMAELLKTNINLIGHAPISEQHAFAEAMKKLDQHELSKLVEYYRPQVELVSERLAEMGAAMPDSSYKTTATFYVLADLSDLIGMPMPKEAERALACSGERLAKTDEDIVYALMFLDKVVLCPLSYFGIDSQRGFVRITCSTGDTKLQALMDRLESRLIEVRKLKYEQLVVKVNSLIERLSQAESKPELVNKFAGTLRAIVKRDYLLSEAMHYKKTNIALNLLISNITFNLEEEKVKACITIQSFFRGSQGRKEAAKLQETSKHEWIAFINKILPDEDPDFLSLLYRRKVSERLKFTPWKNFIETQQTPSITLDDEETSALTMNTTK